MTFWNLEKRTVNKKTLNESLEIACNWIINNAMIKTENHDYKNPKFRHINKISYWKGSLRGEYNARSKEWDVFGPMWHTGQGLKAMCDAYNTTGKQEYLKSAKEMGDFILTNQFRDKNNENYGLILAYEHGSGGINTSAILETLDGIIALYEITKEERYKDSAVSAVNWVCKNMYLEGEGLFEDTYTLDRGKLPVKKRWIEKLGFNEKGRPLLDDGVLLKVYNHVNQNKLYNIAKETADKLLSDEHPEGNWLKYPPANKIDGTIHPRHAYWWGRPMMLMHKLSGEKKYLDCAVRGAEWYKNALRLDGGMFRDTSLDFNTPSFGHALSGVTCAIIFWNDLRRDCNIKDYDEYIKKALDFCMSMQFRDVEDENLQGALLEKVLPPGGTDLPPWYIRDTGTIFYVQAIAQLLADSPDLIEDN